MLLDGTNASDDAGDRPGMKATKELKVLSPLKEAGLTKKDVRRLSKEAGLFTWDKPSYACLATRIPAGEEITPDKLARTEKAEEALKSLGFRDFRIRYMGGAGKLQLTAADMEKAFAVRKEIKKTKNGRIIKSRPRNPNYLIYDGLHEPIIDINTWNIVQEKRKQNPPKVVHNDTIKNPLTRYCLL